MKKVIVLLFMIFSFWDSGAMKKKLTDSASRDVRISPIVDIAFKNVFGVKKNEKVLIDFLNAILKRTDDPIRQLTYQNTEVPPESISEKLSRLDVFVETEKKEKINIEIQVKNTGNMVNRSLYYASKLISKSLQTGELYNKLPRFIMINLLNYNEFTDDRCHRKVILSDAETNEKYTEMLELHFLELAKYKTEFDDEEQQWISFLKDPNNEFFKKDESKKEFTAARETLLILGDDKEFTEQYAQREKEEKDQQGAIETAKAEERKKAEKEKRESARNLLKAGVSPKVVADSLGLSINEITNPE